MTKHRDPKWNEETQSGTYPDKIHWGELKVKSMDKQEIIEGNKLIAEFMGGKFYNDTPTILEKHIVSPSGYAVKCQDKLRYNESWDWLMPVVESIPKLNPDNGKIHFEYEISRCHCKIWSSRQNQWKNNWDTTIGATWKTAVEFLKWFNSQKQ